MKELVDLLNKATEAYDKGEPIMSDKEWDSLYFKLLEMEKEASIVLADSPTQKIHYKTVSKLNKVTHNHPMLSLDKTKSIGELNSFCKKNAAIAMSKMDGLTCSLKYINGKLASAETRGNGIEGEDITHNAMVIPSIPRYINYLDEFVVDGEIICTYGDFKEFEQAYKNPRNFAAGSIRLLSNRECATRKLTFVAWDIININIPTLSHKLELLKSLNFITVPYVLVKEKNVEDAITFLTNDSSKKEYPIDGIVFKYDDCEYYESLGRTEHHARGGIAYKFYDETYPSELIRIDWTMGRTGELTPVAVFTPVDIDGSVVERASLHNLSIMYKTLQCLPCENILSPISKQKVNILKANSIIPQIASSEMPEDGVEYSYLRPPATCPICGSPTTIQQDTDCATLWCLNPLCEGKLINTLDHFVGKTGLDIKGLSKATLEKLIDWGWIGSYKDIFTLGEHAKEWMNKPGFGPKSVSNILAAIENSKTCGLANYITALGIPLIGTSAAKDLEKEFGTWDNFIAAIEDNLYTFENIPNFGYMTHFQLKKFNYDEAKFIAKTYIKFENEEKILDNKNTKDLSNQNFVITGKLNYFKNRDALKEYIENRGGKVVGSVSKNTSYLINNDITSTSSKNKTAKNLNIPIITEEEFLIKFENE